MIYEAYMLDDGGRPLSRLGSWDEADGKPAGFHGSIAAWAEERARMAVRCESLKYPGAAFRVVRFEPVTVWEFCRKEDAAHAG